MTDRENVSPPGRNVIQPVDTDTSVVEPHVDVDVPDAGIVGERSEPYPYTAETSKPFTNTPDFWEGEKEHGTDVDVDELKDKPNDADEVQPTAAAVPSETVEFTGRRPELPTEVAPPDEAFGSGSGISAEEAATGVSDTLPQPPPTAVSADDDKPPLQSWQDVYPGRKATE